jgi:hypothetical protein
MRTTGLIAAVVLMLANAAIRAADIDAMSRPHVTVRIYDSAGLDPATHAHTLMVATGILKQAGIEVTWLGCQSQHGTGPADCGVPLGRTEVAVRFVRVRAEATTHLTLGSSLVDTRARTGSFATIYVNRVERLASGTGISADVLLGRALAHELGHLLLGSSEHANAGLMQAVWTLDVLTRNQASDWWFTEGDARAMRSAVRQRAVQKLAGLQPQSTERGSAK